MLVATSPLTLTIVLKVCAMSSIIQPSDLWSIFCQHYHFIMRLALFVADTLTLERMDRIYITRTVSRT